MEKHVGCAEGERLYLLDNMKAFLLVLVVMGHLLNSVCDQSKFFETIYAFIYIFHMPAFVFITGYFSKKPEKCRTQAVEKYLVPYIVFCVLIQVESRILNIGVGEEMAFRILNPHWGMWYLLAVFWWKLLLKDIVRIRFILPMSLVLGLMTGYSKEFSTYLGIGRTANLLFFFLLGYYCTRERVEKIRKYPKMISVSILAITVIFAYLMVFHSDISRSALYLRSAYHQDNEILEMLIRLVVYLLATGMIFVFINLSSNKPRVYSYIGTNSISVYILHLFLIQFIERFYDFEVAPWMNMLFIVVISLVTVFVFGLPVFEKALKKINDWVCALAFKKKRKIKIDDKKRENVTLL